MIVNYEDSLLLQNTINYSFTQKNKKNRVELIIRPNCNQKCQYCYIAKYGHILYPENIDNSTILQHITLIIDYFIEQEYVIHNLHLFAGDLFFDNLFFDIIPILEKYYAWFSAKKKSLKEKLTIEIPCNMSFCVDDKKIQKVKDIYNHFLKSYNTLILFSYSTDGFYAINTREQKNLTEDYFDKILNLCEEMNWLTHPMISYENVDNAIENYEWFKKRFFPKNKIPIFWLTRNDGWDTQSLQSYKKFLLYYLNDIFHSFYKGNLQQYYQNFYKKNYNFEQKIDSRMTCTMGTFALMINIQDLSIVPCHRLAYPEFKGGKFIIENNKIIKIEALEQINTYLNLKYYNPHVAMQCNTCKYNPICVKGCLGAQYEKFGDVTMINPNICALLRVQYSTAINFFHSIGLFHYIFQNFTDNIIEKQNLKKLLLSFNYIEYEQY